MVKPVVRVSFLGLWCTEEMLDVGLLMELVDSLIAVMQRLDRLRAVLEDVLHIGGVDFNPADADGDNDDSHV